MKRLGLDLEGMGQHATEQSPSPAEVRQQLARLLDGESRGAAWLYDTFATRLFRRLRRRYGYPGGLDSDDLLHDAFVFYFQNHGKVLRDFTERVPEPEQTVERLERHLWDLACGVASNAKRFAARRETERLDPRFARGSDEEQALLRDQLRRLDLCLERRGTRLYLYYKLRFQDGRDPREIAVLTGWSMKATYKLRQKLDEAVRDCADQIGLGLPV